ncbi:tyrosine-type recombinase/integrase [Vulcanococcus sp.]|uniref:tyrosine-type recombinase/integrase n=1 Tax=Vulcanococcus sp. TaxID=2856995 RepID=UPI003F6A2EA1
MTILELWQRFQLERSIALSPTSLSTDYNQVAHWLARCPIQDPKDGRAALVWVLQQEPHKAARRVGGYLKSLYRWACSEDIALVAKNPVATFKFPKPDQREEVTVIPTDAVTSVMAALRTVSRTDTRWDLVSDFMLQTGCRTAEVFGLHWVDVDWENSRCRIHQNMTLTHGLRPRTKTGRERWVPLNSKAVEVLRVTQDLHNEPLVFPWNRHTFMSSFRSAMEHLQAKGVIKKRFRPYDLRHTHISALLERGIPVTQVASWAGNSAQMVWQHYAATTSTYEMPNL